MTVRNWKYEDILRISELERECFKGESWSYRTLASAYENPACHGLVAEDGGEVIGYGCIMVAAENADLENVMVAEAYRRGGAGYAIVQGLIDCAKANGAEKIFLEVRVSNVAAMSLYLKHGFSGVYARTRYYSDGEDCLVMQKNIEG